jgi:hypothetical protein
VSEVLSTFMTMAQMIDAQLKPYGLGFKFAKVDTKASDTSVILIFELTFPNKEMKEVFVKKLKGGGP